MIPTVEQIKTRFRVLLDDPNGYSYTDAVFSEAFGAAYDALFNALLVYQCDRIRIVASTQIAPLTTSFAPSSAFSDFAEFDEVEERLYGSNDKFVTLAQWDKLPQRDMTDRLLDFEWRFDTFYFVGSTTARELRITYESSGSAPSSGSINLDGCLTFLACFAVGVAGPLKGDDELAATNMVRAVGQKYDQGVIGGELWRIIQPRVRERQHVQLAPKPYSASRRQLVRRTPYIAAQQPAGTGVGVPAQFAYSSGTITGTIDGTNAQFFLAYPVTAAQVMLNGVVLTPGTHYTFGANVVNFIAPYIPQPGAEILVTGWV